MYRLFSFLFQLSFSLSMFGLFCVILLIFSFSLFRYFGFGFNYILFHELSIYFHSVVIALGCGYTLFCDRHIRLDILRLSRFRRLISALGFFLFSFPFLGVVLFYGTDYAWRSVRVLESSPEFSGLPLLFLLKCLIPIFACLMFLASIRLWLSSR